MQDRGLLDRGLFRGMDSSQAFALPMLSVKPPRVRRCAPVAHPRGAIAGDRTPPASMSISQSRHIFFIVQRATRQVKDS
jgi:hypothetical protein